MPTGTQCGEASHPHSSRHPVNHPRGFTRRQLWAVNILGLCALLSVCVGCSKERYKAAVDEVREQRGAKWHVVDASENIGFKLHAKNSIEALRGKATAVLVITCSHGPGDVWIEAPAPAAGDVRIAFDDAPPVKRQWGMQADNEILFPWRDEQPSFLAQALKAKTLSFEYRSIGEPAQSSTFDLLDIADLMAKDKRCESPPPVPKRRK